MDNPFIDTSPMRSKKKLVLHIPPRLALKRFDFDDNGNLKMNGRDETEKEEGGEDEDKEDNRDEDDAENEGKEFGEDVNADGKKANPDAKEDRTSQETVDEEEAEQVNDDCHNNVDNDTDNTVDDDHMDVNMDDDANDHTSDVDDDDTVVNTADKNNDDPVRNYNDGDERDSRSPSKPQSNATTESHSSSSASLSSSPSSTEDESESEEEAEIPESVQSEIAKLVATFPGLSSRYKLIDKIGEGTFSSVYKARDLQGSSEGSNDSLLWLSPPSVRKGENHKHRHHHHHKHHKHPIVALKQIYVTSSPQRIYNELHLLHCLVGSPNVAPLIDAMRFEDQVIAVLPYYKHADFRDFYRDLPLAGIRVYMKELLEGLAFVHDKKIIHRDIKPTNFLYDPFSRRGVLVDFGLAERETAPDPNACPCVRGGLSSEEIPPANILPTTGYLKDDPRPGRRANRAGTRGFRAPEVLLKCPNQTRKIDVWSAGVMLLTLLARRFPFFNSSDDIDALTELTTVFGLEPIKKCARLHGLGFECNLPRVEYTHSIGSIIYVAVLLDAKEGDTFAEDSPAWELLVALDKKGHPSNTKLGREYGEALELLEACLRLNYKKRPTAREALEMDFFTKHQRHDTDTVMLE